MSEYVRLGDVCEIQSGGTPSRSIPDYWNGGTIPWVKISDFDGKYLNNTQEFITQKGLENSSAKMFYKGTILYTIFATLGETCILNIDAATNQAIAGIKIIDDRIKNDYLYNFLISKKSFINNIGRGVAQNNINLKILKALEISILTIEEQKQIANTLDKVTALIDKHKKQLEKLDELVKARFVEMFGDSKTSNNKYSTHKLCDLCTVSSSKRIYENEQSSFGIPFLRISNLVDLIENNRFESDLFIPEEKYNELFQNGLVPKVGDILVTSRGTLGKCYIIQEKDKFYFQDGMISWLYNIDKSITPLYLTSLFDTDDIKRQIDNLQAGSTVAYLSIAMLKNLNVTVPPIELQNQFADFVSQVEKTKTEVQKSLEQTETLKKALMQKYFG